MDRGPWSAPRLPPRGPADRGFPKPAPAGFGVNGGSGPGRGKSVGAASGTRRACRVFGGVCGNENRSAERTLSDLGLDTSVGSIRGGRGELHRVILDVLKALQRLLERAIAPELGQNALQGRLPARTGSRRRCSMSGAMARRRKINTRVGRRAARERVRELVSEHDDQVVLLIWGGRVLDGGRCPADLPPVRHSHGSARAASPRAARLSQRRSRAQPVAGEGKCKTCEGRGRSGRIWCGWPTLREARRPTGAGPAMAAGPRSGRISPAGAGWWSSAWTGSRCAPVGVSTDDEAHDVAQEYVDTGQGDRDTP